MINLIIRWFINALALVLVTKIVPGITLSDFGTALLAAAVIGLINALIKPVLLLLTLPINLLTLGLFTFVINAVVLLLAASLVTGFKVEGFGTALVSSILLTIISTLLHSLIA